MRHLDGNAAAGVLAEVFGGEMTDVMETCVHCGSAAPIGAARAYTGGPGTVLRCPHCEDILMSIAWTGRYTVDAMGIARIER
jgi:hypothetical protein